MDARATSSVCSSLVASTAPRSQVASRVHRVANANRGSFGKGLNSRSFAGVKLTAASSARVVSASRANAVSVSAEISYVMIKPDGVQRGLVGEIISRFERKGFSLKGLKLFKCSQDLAEEHYGELKTKKFFPALVEYVISGPVVCMVWEGDGVVASARKLIGKTDPLEAEPGTIRGDFAVNKGRNVVHGSDSMENGVRETGLWFDDDEVLTWEPTMKPWIVE